MKTKKPQICIKCGSETNNPEWFFPLPSKKGDKGEGPLCERCSSDIIMRDGRY
jgi:DNA-directed RNA polymerase subunit RPC12/RpoP